MKMRAPVWWIVVFLASVMASGGALAADKAGSGLAVQFRADRAGVVSINLYRADGMLVRRLVQSQRFAAGAQKVVWDGRGDDGVPVPPGEYAWKGLFHEGIGLKLRGWAGNGEATPWPTPDGKGEWGGETGVPNAAAADAQKVYLGWSNAEVGKAIVACDLEGRVQWSHRRAEGPSGCKALAVDDGLLYVLGGLKGGDAEGGAVYRLNVKDGRPVPWPNGKLDLKISALWPPDSVAKPEKANAMAVRHGHIYLTFTEAEFLAVLDAKTCDYLQTVVGAPPGQIDVAATRTNLPDAPGKLVDADFAVISLGGGVFGKVLFAHDPLWVVTSEMEAVKRDVAITALTVLGDSAKIHRHDVFIGLGRPFHQVQARPLLDADSIKWFAGKAGGRPLLGPWEPDALRDIRAVALAADGKLWVAEGDEFPKRFSVWETYGQQGKLAREFFGPGGSGGAINPLNPDLMFAQGCEWRIDRKTGRAACLGVVTRDGAGLARYAVGENGNAYLIVSGDHGIDILERVGDGDYKLRASVYSDPIDRITGAASDQPRTFAWSDENGDGVMQSSEQTSIAASLKIWPGAALQDLTLSTATADQSLGRVFKVRSWSPCGAPRYDLSDPLAWWGRLWLSADQRLALGLTEATAGRSDKLACHSLPDGRERWSMPVPHGISLQPGSALLAAPIGNVWLAFRESDKHAEPEGVGSWTLINEDGFEVARLFASDRKKIQWPKAALPGADMSNAVSSHEGRLTQAADGKLYLQAGDTADWNLEVTGLDKVRSLPGGLVTIPAPK